jgi:hypothetical protein
MHKVLIFEGPLFTIFETKLKSNLSSQSAVPPFLHHSLLLRSVNNFLIHLSLSPLKRFFPPYFHGITVLGTIASLFYSVMLFD